MNLFQSPVGAHRLYDYEATVEEIARINKYMRRKGLDSPFQDTCGMFSTQQYKFPLAVASDLLKTINGSSK